MGQTEETFRKQNWKDLAELSGMTKVSNFGNRTDNTGIHGDRESMMWTLVGFNTMQLIWDMLKLQDCWSICGFIDGDKDLGDIKSLIVNEGTGVDKIS